MGLGGGPLTSQPARVFGGAARRATTTSNTELA